MMLEISEVLTLIDKDDIIKVKYYKNKGYHEIIGELKGVNTTNKKLLLKDDTIINFDDILKIKRI